LSRRPVARSSDPAVPDGDQTLDVVVWEADGNPLPGAGYGRNIAMRLGRLGWRVAVVDYRTRPLSGREWAAPVHVLSGGETSAHAADRATLQALDEIGELAQRAWADEVTIIGICLGAQLVARVLAPDLPPSTPLAGMEAGWRSVTGPQGPVGVAELHYEQLHPDLTARDGITVTHHNAHSEIQGFRWGSSVIGLQFHPEWSPADLRSVLDRHPAILTEHHRDPAAALASAGHAPRHWRPAVFDQLVAEPVARRLSTRPIEVAEVAA
jgi:GMP synthase-like glutamine amidotransferase